MKVKDMVIEVVRRRLPTVGLTSDLGRFGGEVEQGILRVITDEGVEGVAMVGEFRRGGGPHFEGVLGAIKPEIVGRSVWDREWLWGRRALLEGRRGVTAHAWACVDIALWDVAGKVAGQPVYELLGASRREVPVYATYPPRHEIPEGYLEEARQLMSAGFRAYKIHPGALSTRDVMAVVEGVRSLVGDDVALMLDPNNGYGFRKAYEVGRLLDANGFYWYEDPLPPWDVGAIAELGRRLATPLCMSDRPEDQFHEAPRLMREAGLRLIRGTARKLGVTGLKKLCSVAEAFGMNCEIGTAGNPTGDMANLHVMLSMANCDFFEYWLPLEAHQFGLTAYLRAEGEGLLRAPEGPGLGVRVDWEWVRGHRVATLR